MKNFQNSQTAEEPDEPVEQDKLAKISFQEVCNSYEMFELFVEIYKGVVLVVFGRRRTLISLVTTLGGMNELEIYRNI